MKYLEFRKKIQNIKNDNKPILIESLGYEIKIKDVDLVSNILYNLIYPKEQVYQETNIFNRVKEAYNIICELYKYPRVLMYGLNANENLKLHINFELVERPYLKDSYIVENNKTHFSINKKDIEKLYDLTEKSNLTTIILTGKTDYLISNNKCIEIDNKRPVLPLLIDMSNKMGLLFSDFLAALTIYNLDTKDKNKNYLLNNYNSELLKYLVDIYLDQNLNYIEFNKKIKPLLKTIDMLKEDQIESIVELLLKGDNNAI